ncbi:MAG: dTMP kinase [Thermoleophilia bacterium]|nr:dTMP kinase [Thermoleophilia bacterium]
MTTGLLITFEGVDGCGKTTQLRRLEQRLIAAGHAPLVVREPGGTGVGEALRELVLAPETGDIDPATEALIYAASRAENVARVIEPALAAGRIVLMDRYVDSSLAYQGGGRELGIDRVLEANLLATRGRLPDATVLVAVTPAVAAARLGSTGDDPDRLESAGDAFFTRVHAAYAELVARFPDRVLRVDGAAAVAEVARAVEAALEPVLAAAGVTLAAAAAEVRA